MIPLSIFTLFKMIMAQQNKNVTNMVEVFLRVSPIITIWGKRKLKYELSDFNYGEWVIFKDNFPKYYLNMFDKEYDSIRELPDFDIENRLKMHKGGLSIHQKLFGISLWNKSFIKSFNLEKLPTNILSK